MPEVFSGTAVDSTNYALVDVQKWDGTALGAPSNYGTSPGAVAVIGVNAFVTNTIVVDGALTNNNAAPTATLLGVMDHIAETSYTTVTYSTGDVVLATTDLHGATNIDLQAYLGSAVSATNPVMTTWSDGTTAIAGAVSPWGIPPTGTEVMGVNANIIAAAQTIHFINGAGTLNTSGTTTTYSYTPAQAGNFIVIGIQFAVAVSAVTCVDNLGNVLVANADNGAVGTTGTTYQFHGFSQYGTTSYTVSWTTSSAWYLVVGEYSGVGQVTASGAAGNSTTPTVSVTSTLPGQWLISDIGIVNGSGVTYTALTGTLRFGVASSLAEAIGLVDNTAAASGSITTAVTLSSAKPWGLLYVLASPSQTVPVQLAAQTIPLQVTFSGTATVAGALTNNNAAPTATLIGVLPAIAETAYSTVTYNTGDMVLPVTDLHGALNTDLQAVLGAAMSKTNPVFVQLTDGTNAIAAAVSAWGVAPTGTEVQGVNANIVAGTITAVTSITNTVTTSTVPVTSGGCSAAVSQALTSSVNVKSTAGQLYGYQIYNPNAATPVYVFWYNTTTTPGTIGSTTNLVCQMGIPAGSAANVSLDNGVAFSSGIAVAVSTSATSAAAPSIGLVITTIYK